MNPIDIAVIALLILGFIWGFSKGFIYMIFSLLAILGGAFTAGKVVPLIVPHLFSQANYQLGYIILFVIIFTLVYFIIKKITYLLEDMVEFLELEWLDSLMGGFIGLFQLLIIIGVLVNIVNSMGMFKLLPSYEDIKFAFLISDTSQRIVTFIAGNIGSIRPVN
jgi:membrane protein required for colicin V production